MSLDGGRRCFLRGLVTTGLADTFSLVGPSGDSDDLPRYIAHAMGGIDGEVYTNSLEAWETNYESGCRWFEVDLWRTSDNELVAYHEGLRDRYGLPDEFTADQFVESKFDGEYTPLDVRELASLMEQASDWRLVTDVKNGFLRSLVRLQSALRDAGIDYRERVVPQIYNLVYNLPVARILGFTEVIFTLYRSSLTNEQVVNRVEKCDSIGAVTMSEDRYSETFVERLNEIGVPVYVHTVNDEAKIGEYLNAGVRGVYTDFGCESNV